MPLLDVNQLENVMKVVELLYGKWTVQILHAMRDKSVCLSELRRLLPLASKKAITMRLRELESTGLLMRKDLSGIVLRVEYELTERMYDPRSHLIRHPVEMAELHLGDEIQTVGDNQSSGDGSIG